MKKRLMAVLLTAGMLLTLLPVSLWARAEEIAGSDNGGDSAVSAPNGDTGGDAGYGSSPSNSPAAGPGDTDSGNSNDGSTDNGSGSSNDGSTDNGSGSSNDGSTDNGNASSSDGSTDNGNANSNDGSSGNDNGSGKTETPGTTPNRPGSSDGGGGTVSAPVTTTKTVESAWITRTDLPGYATDFYTALVTGSDNNQPSDVLTQDSSYTVNTRLHEDKVSSVEQVEVVTVTEPDYLAEFPADGDALAQESVYTLPPSAGDQAINYNTLIQGNLVRTSAFNGIYVTSVVKTGNGSFDADCETAKDCVMTAARSFDRDHPEVFWLSGKTMLRIVTANVSRSGNTVQEAFFFYVLADSSGFSARDEAYSGSGAIQSGIQKRDQAVKAILAAVPRSGAYEQISALNKWLTQHNEYNTSADLYAIGNGPHRCLSALTGSVGTTGPVCEGYSKAFKVLCDQLQIPCVLEMGNARATPDGAVGLHMWNSVKMPDGKWYGSDITWDDPVVAGKTGAVSGAENEDYLLVGSSTVIRGMRFDASHQPGTDGAYGNGPFLSATAYNGEAASNLPFTDVPGGAYYADAVQWALDNGVTTGTTATTFSPNDTCTRGQVVTFLWRAKGEPAPKTAANPFADVKTGDYYYNAVLWAVEQGITTGTSATAFSPTDTCTRAHIVTFLWRCLGQPGRTGQGTWYDDAVNWANGAGLLSGTAQAFSPGADCPRADVVTYLYRALTR